MIKNSLKYLILSYHNLQTLIILQHSLECLDILINELKKENTVSYLIISLN